MNKMKSKKTSKKTLYTSCIKRFLDIIISLIAIISVVLVCIPIAFLIYHEDGGSVFYKSERYGLHMKKFNMIKFRSMKMNSDDIRNEDGTTYNSDKDPRMTKIGSFLRRTSLDELPQFFNVLIGDMSIIGPRPSPMGNEKTYTEFVMRKFNVRPGITGYNQALKRNSATLEERYNNDVWYSDHISFKLDIKIFFMTIKAVLMQENIYNS